MKIAGAGTGDNCPKVVADALGFDPKISSKILKP
jgi:hypothetical protein